MKLFQSTRSNALRVSPIPEVGGGVFGREATLPLASSRHNKPWGTRQARGTLKATLKGEACAGLGTGKVAHGRDGDAQLEPFHGKQDAGYGWLVAGALAHQPRQVMVG